VCKTGDNKESSDRRLRTPANPPTSCAPTAEDIAMGGLGC